MKGRMKELQVQKEKSCNDSKNERTSKVERKTLMTARKLKNRNKTLIMEPKKREVQKQNFTDNKKGKGRKNS